MKWLGCMLAAAALLPAQDAARPHITGVAHIALFASDFEKSRAFYRDFLGLEEPYSLAKPDGTPAMTFFKINERQYIELFPETAPKTDRLSHISLETDNAEGMRLYLASRGVAVPKTVPKGRIGNSNFNIKDPEGHTAVSYTHLGNGAEQRPAALATFAPVQVLKSCNISLNTEKEVYDGRQFS